MATSACMRAAQACIDPTCRALQAIPHGEQLTGRIILQAYAAPMLWNYAHLQHIFHVEGFSLQVTRPGVSPNSEGAQLC